ncbi:Acyl-CoA oxidase/dehydrogenase middle domain-containing protein [Plasmodiophora brassicae]
MGQIENRLADCLRNDRISAVDLQQAIAVAKAKVVETSISLCFALKQDVGSSALMAGKGFENLGTKARLCVIEAGPGCQTSCNAASSPKAAVAF